ncbi:M35 family metallopeptidase [Xanthomonas campestris]|uniref:M35 family metallopeptidase n=1 Tax=Xanthomonas campestris TaxID=339 RepID=UPI0021D927BC|nr:M35 family metallopeptidase [Xanthomonas campestris]
MENNISPNALAWVTPGTLYQVNLCPRFFESPQFPTVYDEFSQVGTFLREITHFSDEIVNGTIDDPSGYTYAGTKALAGNRTRAVRNAQSYKFYYLNLNLNFN